MPKTKKTNVTDSIYLDDRLNITKLKDRMPLDELKSLFEGLMINEGWTPTTNDPDTLITGDSNGNFIKYNTKDNTVTYLRIPHTTTMTASDITDIGTYANKQGDTLMFKILMNFLFSDYKNDVDLLPFSINRYILQSDYLSSRPSLKPEIIELPSAISEEDKSNLEMLKTLIPFIKQDESIYDNLNLKADNDEEIFNSLQNAYLNSKMPFNEFLNQFNNVNNPSSLNYTIYRTIPSLLYPFLPNYQSEEKTKEMTTILQIISNNIEQRMAMYQATMFKKD